MANNSYDKFLCANKALLDNFNTTLECILKIEEENLVTKILSVDSRANVESVECLNGEANINGTICVQIVYMLENGEVNCSTANSQFLAKCTNSNINVLSKLNIKVFACSGTVLSVQNNTIKIQNTIEMNGYCLNNDEVTYLTQGEDNCFSRNIEKTVMEYVKGEYGDFSENFDFAPLTDLKKLLMTNYCVSCKECTVQNGYVVCSGEICINLCYASTEENEGIKNVQYKHTFSQEIECDAVNRDSTVACYMDMDFAASKCMLTQNENTQKMEINAVCKYSLQVFKETTIVATLDMYSTAKKSQIKSAEYTFIKNQKHANFEKNIEGSIILDSQDEVAKTVAFNSPCASVTNAYFDDEQLFVSGLIKCNLLYLNFDEELCSTDLEFPFMTSMPYNCERDNAVVTCNIGLCDFDVIVKKGKDVYIDCKLCVNCDISENYTDCVVSDIEYFEEHKSKDCSIEIYFAKAGESVFEIAKELYVNPELIYMQNNLLLDVFEKDEKIAVYYKKA